MVWVVLIILLIVLIVKGISTQKRKREERLIWECDHMEDSEEGTRRLYTYSRYSDEKSWKIRCNMYNRLAEAGDHFAEGRLARIYRYDKKDEKKAFELFLRAANGDDRDSMYEVAEAYYEGKVVPKDYNIARYWAMKGLAAGNSKCDIILGLIDDESK